MDTGKAIIQLVTGRRFHLHWVDSRFLLRFCDDGPPARPADAAATSGCVTWLVTRGPTLRHCGTNGPRDRAEFDRSLTEIELKERVRRLSLLSPHHVADAYRQAYAFVTHLERS